MKKAISLLLALVLCLSLCACGNDGNANTQGNSGILPTPNEGSSQDQNDGQYTAYVYDGDPTDLLTIEEVVLMPERNSLSADPTMYLYWKTKVRNTSGEDIPLNSYLCVWYRYLDENEDTLYSNFLISDSSSSVKNDRAVWVEENGIPGSWTDQDSKSIAYLEIYAYAFGSFSKPQYEFTDPVLIDVREIFDWEDVPDGASSFGAIFGS